MTPHTNHRRLAVCLGIFLGVLSMNAAAIEPGSVKGKFTYDGKVYTLRHVHAYMPHAQSTELWVYIADATMPAAVAQENDELEKILKEGRFRGLSLRINPTKPDLESLDLEIYAHKRFTFEETGGGPKWKRLVVGGKRVVGKLQYAGVDSGLNWSLDVEFSAPVYGLGGGEQTSAGTKAPVGAKSSAGTKTLTGAQAQKSPQAEVFLAYEKALLSQGLDAAGAHMSPERLAEEQKMFKQFSAAQLTELRTERRKSTAQGEARRQQIKKVVVDGDYAVLETTTADSVPLVKIKGGWKVGLRR